MKIFAIETSCDETAVAVVEEGVKILGSTVASSAAMHEKYGGIVPEVAARKQIESIQAVLKEALTQAHADWQDIDAIAVTVGPGLIGSLLVGVETAKTIAFVTGKPIIPVNHVIAHMYANFVKSDERDAVSNIKHKTVEFPAISLVVSGGHTELYLMTSMKKLKWLGGTLDDAAGEAFDKSARLLGFGAGGGPAIQKAATTYTKNSKQHTVKLPRPMISDDSLNFSFSGLKTAIVREAQKFKTTKQWSRETIHSFAFEIQEAITDVLVAKTYLATRQYHAKSILLSGGVAANRRLREKMSLAMNRLKDKTMHVPPPALCTDNAVYIASCAFFRGKPTDWHSIAATPDLSVEEPS